MRIKKKSRHFFNLYASWDEIGNLWYYLTLIQCAFSFRFEIPIYNNFTNKLFIAIGIMSACILCMATKSQIKSWKGLTMIISILLSVELLITQS